MRTNAISERLNNETPEHLKASLSCGLCGELGTCFWDDDHQDHVCDRCIEQGPPRPTLPADWEPSEGRDWAQVAIDEGGF